MSAPFSLPVWRKSSRCTNAACVEVAEAGDTVLMRDSKNPDGQPLTFSKADWYTFLEEIITGTPSNSS